MSGREPVSVSANSSPESLRHENVGDKQLRHDRQRLFLAGS